MQLIFLELGKDLKKKITIVNNCHWYWKLYRYSVGFDIDPDAIKIAQENSESFEVNIDFVNTDLSVATLDGFKGKLDTIIMNPPFGTKNNKGVDMVLLKKAIDVNI